ncbi:hypothetical protein JGI14_101133 [Candidatus Kryptonium thompsonii]|uniref:Uncharacterized protein n=1 Tax=Candidatus Kryptonium thompsonii TaxID=1633631 RepID=A0A0P1M1M5_9BACT|nr:hypothetical protein [Candidatus Kryptonium thompsoni]CUS78458.1 hypothetical protein JGI15_100351 [Candidatus Kryptonium thompsoni]CUS81475.1 hypothetical protein JGI6_00006 [Candidatus Kryptonium thompsoni]CUS81972.1 hypothetical protein JGI14_101133 [Candidatus Kryptonium thompsoni]CUS84098.1 hypothetical protein JGI10_00975 [Candidatus Kryptonium thompsoni]CUS88434.1 hypothetical protein JGI12_01159 [Candidatus Kryptonium thompsoni]
MKKIILFIVLLRIATLNAQDKNLLSIINVQFFIKVQPNYEIVNAYFPFLSNVKVYKFELERQVLNVIPNIRSSGPIFYDFDLGLVWKNITLSLRLSTTYLAPIKPTGNYITKNNVFLNKLDRSIPGFTNLNLQYKFLKYLELFIQYENKTIGYSTSKDPLNTVVYFTGRYKLSNVIILGGCIDFEIAKLKMLQSVGMSLFGKYSHDFLVFNTHQDSGKFLIYLQPFREQGTLNIFSYTANFGYKIRDDMQFDLFFEYRYSRSKEIFKESLYRFGVRFILIFL